MGLYVEYSGSGMEHVYVQFCRHIVQGHMSVIRNVCMPVYLVTLLTVVSSYEAYIVTLFSHMHMSYLAYMWHLKTY